MTMKAYLTDYKDQQGIIVTSQLGAAVTQLIKYVLIDLKKPQIAMDKNQFYYLS